MKMKGTVVCSTGSYLPLKVIHNEDFGQFPDPSKYIISQKTGVFSRRCAEDGECTSDLAYKSAKQCIDKVEFPPEQIECIIVSTSSPDRIQPATATRTQHLLGAVNSFAFDINSVCSGSTYGIFIADSLIKSGKCNNVLFIASEIYSRILNKKDFSTYPFFGDGSGAILFRADDVSNSIIHTILRTDGSGSETICVPGGGTMLPYEKLPNPNAAFFKMKGKTVFEFAVSKGTEIIKQILEESKTTIKDIKYFICHQANINIILKIAENIEAPLDKFYVNLFRYGNTASASVIIALDEIITRGMVNDGDLVATVAFGGGLSWGANLIEI